MAEIHDLRSNEDQEKILASINERLDRLRAAPLPTEPAKAISSNMTREEMDAKLEAAEARNSAHYIDLQHKIEGLTAAITGERGVLAEMRDLREENKATLLQARQEGQFTRWTLFGIALAIIGTFIAVLAFGGDQFGSGKELGGSLSTLEAKIDQLQADRTASVAEPSPPAEQPPAAPPKGK